MEAFKLNSDVIAAMLFLAPGYAAFRLYFIDRPWNALNPIHIIYGSLIFSTAAFFSYSCIISFGVPDSSSLFVLSTVGFSLVYAIVWRRWGHDTLHNICGTLLKTNEDNSATPWTLIFNNRSLFVTQIVVHLKDGTSLQCDDTAHFYKDNLINLDVFPYYASTEGDIYLIATHHRRSRELEWQPVPEVHILPPWGIKMSFVPAREISRVEARVTPAKN